MLPSIPCSLALGVTGTLDDLGTPTPGYWTDHAMTIQHGWDARATARCSVNNAHFTAGAHNRPFSPLF